MKIQKIASSGTVAVKHIEITTDTPSYGAIRTKRLEGARRFYEALRMVNQS
jgi:hypothetical protein